MRRALLRPLLGAALLLAAVPVSAQESGQAGLTIGFPGSIGILWHVSDAVAVRPDFSFAHNSSESDNSGLTSSSWVAGFGVSANFYVGKIGDNIRTYVTPRFGYGRTSSESTTTAVTFGSETHTNNYQYAGSFGVQYMPTRRFGMYGEAGVQYTRATSSFTADTTLPIVNATGKSTNSTFSSRAGIGLVLYFK